MIILAKKKHIEELCKLRVMQQKEDWQDEYPNNDTEVYEITKRYLEEHLNKDLYLFIELIDNKIVGTCGLQIIKYMPQCARTGIEGFICNVFTLKEYRRRGICTNLLKECFRFSKEMNVEKLKLICDVPNARKLYEKHGFIKEEYIMKKKIQ